MYTFLATCTDDSGRDVVVRVEAEGLKHARDVLEERGFTNIVFETDSELYPTKARLDLSAPRPPAQELATQRTGKFPWSWWLRTWAQNLAPFLLWNAVSWWQGPPYGVLDWIGFGLTGCVLLAALLLGIPYQLYHCLLEASAWSRWDRVLVLAPLMAAAGRILGLQMLVVDVRFRRARALLGTGRYGEAFASVADLGGPGTELGRRAELHWAAGERDVAVALRRRAAELVPDKADPWIDYAHTLARTGDLAGGRDALARARACEITSLAASWISFTDGLLALEEGRCAGAAELLAQAIDENAKLSDNALAEACRHWWRGYLTVALAGAGRTDEARRTLAECRALLASSPDLRELLERCERAVR